MSGGRGRGKINTSELKKDDKAWAGPKLAAISFTNTESAMDEYLSKLDLYRKPVAKDGSCLFRVVSEQVYNTQAKHIKVRFECIDFMRRNKELFQAFVEGSYEHHLYLLKNPKEWGGQVEISALSLLYKYDFIVYQAINHPPQQVTCNNFKRKIHLCYSNGNHYDAVYPLRFKASAAMVQSLLYDVVLDSTFREVERKEMTKDGYTEDIVPSKAAGWTEVKNKQKGKTEETNERVSSTDRIINIFPDAAKNQKLYWQLQRSFDSTLYRNIELEVWEDFRADITKSDYALAASMQQLKAGDICLATIKESETISDTIRVKISEINPDKCVVYSEDERHRYYVQLHDLSPLVNGHASDHKSLPGYYNKHEDRDTEFQQPRRRGKGNKKAREDEERSRKYENCRGGDSKRHDARTNGKRGSRKEQEKRQRDNIDAKTPVTSTRKPRAETDVKKVEKSEENIPKMGSPIISPDEPPKVAKPAETSAAFWGRMNKSSIPTVNSPLSNGFHSPSSPLVESHEKTPTQTPNNESTLINGKTGPSKTFPEKGSRPDTAPSAPRIKPAWGNIPTVLSPVVETSNTKNNSQPSVAINPNKLRDRAEQASATNVKSKQLDLKIPKVNDIAVSEARSDSNTLPENFPSHTDTATEVSDDSLSVKQDSSPKANLDSHNTTTLLTVEDQKLFNLTTQASAKVNEIRGNILATSAKISGSLASIKKSNDYGDDRLTNEPLMNYEGEVCETPQQPPTVPIVATTTAATPQAPVVVDTKETSSNVKQDPTNINSTDISHDEILPPQQPPTFEERSSPEGEVVEEHLNNNTTDNTNTHKGLPNGDITAEQDIPNDDELIDDSINFVEEPQRIQSNKNLLVKEEGITKEKSKKKVSFGGTSIIDNPNHVMSQVPTVNMQPTTSLTTLSEPGKIILPPEHIEKHINEFPSTNNPEVPNYHHHNHQQQPQFIPTFIQSPNIPFYASTHPSLPMVRMIYPNNTLHELQPHQVNTIQPVISVDPEGKDLPEDIGILRYFYNMGIQWHYLVNQPNNVHLNQPGILPPPVQTQSSMHAATVRPMVVSDPTHMRSLDCYSPGSQTNDTTSHMELLTAQHTPAGTFISNNRLHTPSAQPPNIIHMQHAPQSYEEYEVPPRHQRSGLPLARGTTPRHLNQRHFMNPRGIMGQTPRHRHQIRSTPTHQGNHLANF